MFVGTCTRSKKTPIYKNSCHKTRHRCFKNLETRHCETKIMQLVDHLSKAKLIHKRFAIFFRWGGTLSQLVKSIEIYTKDQACFSYYRLNILFTKQPCN